MRAIALSLPVRSLAAAGALAAVGATAFWWSNCIPDVTLAPASAGHFVRAPRSAVLAMARATMLPAQIDAFVTEQSRRASAPDATGADWRILAEAHLESVLLKASSKGMAVARPSFPDLPPDVERHLEAGERAIEKARALGDTHSEVARIEAGLKSNRIVGVGSALRLGREVDRLIEEAAERDPGNPHAAVARGCRLLFAPKFLGGDPARALHLFEQAAAAMPDDERPLVFAAFAAHLTGDRARTRQHLEAACQRNPRNRYAAAVAERMARGEADPFGRDLPP